MNRTEILPRTTISYAVIEPDRLTREQLEERLGDYGARGFRIVERIPSSLDTPTRLIMACATSVRTFEQSNGHAGCDPLEHAS